MKEVAINKSDLAKEIRARLAATGAYCIRVSAEGWITYRVPVLDTYLSCERNIWDLYNKYYPPFDKKIERPYEFQVDHITVISAWKQKPSSKSIA